MPDQKPKFLYDVVTIHGIPARVFRQVEPDKPKEKWPVVDLQLPLTDRQYGQLQSQFDDKQRRWQTSCYTKIFQDELAGFEEACLRQKDLGKAYKKDGINILVLHLKKWSAAYVDLEALINNPPVDSDPLKILIDRLNTLAIFMNTEDMPDTLRKALFAFRQQAIDLRDNFATKEQIRQFFSIQKEKRNAPCLGKFLAEQMTAMAQYGSDEVYKRKSRNESNKFMNRLTQAFAMHPLLKYLSDAQANIEVKSASIYGTELNNVFLKVPQGMLDTIRGTVHVSDDPSTRKWTSISEHVSDLGNLAEVDNIIKVLAQNKELPRAKSSVSRMFWVFFWNVFELSVMATIRFAVSVALGFVHIGLKITVNTLGQVLGGIGLISGLITGSLSRAKTFRSALIGISDKIDEKIGNFFKTIDEQMGRIYRYLSPVIRTKHNRNEQLEIDAHLKKELNQPISVYDQILSGFGSAYFGAFAANAANSAIETLATASYSIRSLTTTIKPDDVAKSVQEATAAAWLERLSKMAGGDINQSASLISPSANISTPLKTIPVRSRLDRIEENKIHSFMMPFIEIGIGLSDEIIGPMFRKSPGLATLCFLAANASFAALTAPAITGAVMGSTSTHGLGTFGAKIGGWSMGKATGEHLVINNLFAAFLQWKLTFFPLEVTGEVIHGDLQFLEKLFQNPEKLTLGMTVMVGMGWAMQYLPTIPSVRELGPLNIYADIANIFGHEAHEVTHGGELLGPDGKPLLDDHGHPLHHSPAKWPINSLEYAFLSLKSVFILQTMGEGGHTPLSEPVRKLFSPRSNQTNAQMTFQEKYPVLFDIIEAMRVNAADLALQLGLPVYADNVTGQNKFTGSFQDLMNHSQVGEQGFQTLVIEPALDAATQSHGIHLSEDDKKTASFYLLENAKASVEANREISQNLSIIEAYTANETAPETLTGKRLILSNAIETVIKMEQMGTTFETVDPLTGKTIQDTAKANAYYDYLYRVFKDYNTAQRLAGHPENEVDKNAFLHAFYNKHCYKGSNNLLRMFSFFPAYPLVVTWRWTQSLINNTVRPLFGLPASAAMNEKLDKSWAKDKIIGFQLLAIGGRVGHELVRAYTFGFRAIYLALSIPVTAALWIFPAGPALYAYRVLTQGSSQAKYPSVMKGFNDRIDEALSVAPYENQGRYLSAFVGLFTGEGLAQARAASKAGVGSSHLLDSATTVQKQLNLQKAKELHETSHAPVLHAFAYQQKNLFSSKASRRAEKDSLEHYGRGIASLKDRAFNLELRCGVLASAADSVRPLLEGINEKIAALDVALPKEKVHEELARRTSEMKNHLHALDTLESQVKALEKKQGIMSGSGRKLI